MNTRPTFEFTLQEKLDQEGRILKICDNSCAPLTVLESANKSVSLLNLKTINSTCEDRDDYERFMLIHTFSVFWHVCIDQSP